jgi:2-polyprenyl-3-methyl-5-hydroxy-6-metoxy-1,4-benzoquinol methylase
LYANLMDLNFHSPGVWCISQCVNVNCGLLWLDPMPDAKDIDKLYADYYTHQDTSLPLRKIVQKSYVRSAYEYVKNGYLSLRFGYDTSRSTFQKCAGLLLFLHPARVCGISRSTLGIHWRRGGRVLDVGCGSGDILAVLQSLGWHAEGVEPDPVASKQARAKGLKVHTGTLAGQNFPGESFDVIILSHVVEHVPEPIELLKQCHRLLRHDGRLVVITPNSESWGHRIFESSWRELDPPRHFFVFRSNSLNAVVTRAGFKVSSLITSSRSSRYIFRMSRLRSSQQITHSRFHPLLKFTGETIAAAFALMEFVSLKLGFKRGEELILKAVK